MKEVKLQWHPAFVAAMDLEFVQAYACLYKSYGKAVDAIKAEDITLSIIREIKPDALFRYFKNHGWSVSEYCKGV